MTGRPRSCLPWRRRGMSRQTPPQRASSEPPCTLVLLPARHTLTISAPMAALSSAGCCGDGYVACFMHPQRRSKPARHLSHRFVVIACLPPARQVPERRRGQHALPALISPNIHPPSRSMSEEENQRRIERGFPPPSTFAWSRPSRVEEKSRRNEGGQEHTQTEPEHRATRAAVGGFGIGVDRWLAAATPA